MAAPRLEEKLEESWHAARLIPTTGIGGAEEQEERATSSLLAVMYAVPEFGRALLVHAGAPAGRITTFTEVYVKDLEAGTTSIPDAAIVVERGKARWRALVEVKTGNNALRKEQVERYLELARINAFDAVVTISNDITSTSHVSPIIVDPRKTKKVELRHLSWFQITTEAVLQYRHRKVSDPDQAWLLGELIAYLENEKSGAGGFEDMGDLWVTVRDEARAKTLNVNSKGAKEIPRRWEQFVEHLAMILEQELGRDVTPAWPRKLDSATRLDNAVRRLVEEGSLAASIRVPDAAAPIDLDVNLRTREVTTSASFAAPREGRSTTRINWLLRQLKDAPPTLRVEVRYPNTKDVTSMLLRDAVVAPQQLLHASDFKREPKEFTIAWARPMGIKRGKLAGSFVGDTKAQVTDFYRGVLQTIKPWLPSAPRLPAVITTVDPTLDNEVLSQMAPADPEASASE
ncbi:MAG: hypothetical protein WKF56_05960 [Candidatus Limnocylindrales bacterium]